MLALVENIVNSKLPQASAVEHNTRNASGGRPRVFRELHHFLRDVERVKSSMDDIVVVTIDGNCQGFNDIRNLILNMKERAQYQGFVACAVPDPHIEKWYLSDPENLAKALSSGKVPKLPIYKCERSIYKSELNQTLASIGVRAPLGGTEYGREIAQGIDLFQAGQNDSSLKHFIDDFCGIATNFLNP